MKVAALLAAIAAFASAAGASPLAARTILRTKGQLIGFAQDGPRFVVATDTASRGCGIFVRAYRFGARHGRRLNTRTGPSCGNYGNTRGPLDLVYGGGTALWRMTYGAHFSYQDLLESSLAHPRDRLVDEVVYDNDAYFTGDHVANLAADGSTVVYGWYRQSVTGSENCDVEQTCTVVVAGGGVERVDRRGRHRAVPGAPPAAVVTAAAGRIALVRATPAVVWYHPQNLSSAVEVRDAADGTVVASFSVPGLVRALALTRSVVGVLVGRGSSARVDRYALPSGRLLGTVAAPGATTLSLAGNRAVIGAGRRIELLDASSGTVRTIARAHGAVVGASIEGRRVAWGESRRTYGVVRALMVG